MFDLHKKVVLIIGGRGYLGRDFCQKLIKQGATVISSDLPVPSKASSKSSYTELSCEIEQLDIDVEDQNSVTEIINYVFKKYKKIDTLIYSATTKPQDFYYPYTECSLAGWQKVIKVELDGIFLATQACGKIMESQGYGNIILIGSIYGVVGNDQRIYKDSNLSSLYGSGNKEFSQTYSHAAYPAVKGGIISLVRYLAAYWGDKQIRVNCISPGGVEHIGENKNFIEKYIEKVPLGRKASVEDISAAIVFLSSDESSYITGQNIVIDGGWTAW